MDEGPSMPPRTDGGSTIGTLAYLTAGPLIWALHLTVVYGLHTAWCTVGLREGSADPAVISAVVIAVTGVALAMLAAMLWRPDTVRRLLRVSGRDAATIAFQDGVMRLLVALSAAGVAWAGAAAFVVASCAQLR